nr:HAMP domain-containing protein [Pleurocapsa sp. MO_226.B13]
MTTKQESSNLKPASSSRLPTRNQIKASSLRRRLLFTILPTVLIPLLVASGIGQAITERRAKTQVLRELENNTVLSSKTVATFLRDAFKTIDLVVANPEIPQAMKAGAKKAEEEKLTERSISELEQQFATTRRLIADDNLTDYLQKTVRYSPIAEIFFTDRNGFNVAYSNLTSDFVQNDEDWWKNSQVGRREINGFAFDESANTNVFELSEVVKDSQTGDFLGVIKAGIAVNILTSDIENLYGEQNRDFHFQIVDPNSSLIISNIELHKEREIEDGTHATEAVEVLGGEAILDLGKTLVQVADNSLTLAEAKRSIEEKSSFSEVNININQDRVFSETIVTALLRYQNQFYSVSTVPKTNLVSIGEIDYEVVASVGRSLQIVFILTAVVLGLVSLAIIILLARQITKPLTNLSATTQKVAAGNLDIEADIKGTLETQTLAYNFNNLVKQTRESLQTQKALAEEQRQEKEQLEAAIATLLNEVSDATEGDLTVRANLNSIELSTVAD